jgi:hypothetical protein
MCVQRFDDSLYSAIRITYRISLRSSSLREPRYPLLKVVNAVLPAVLIHPASGCLRNPARALKFQNWCFLNGVKKVESGACAPGFAHTQGAGVASVSFQFTSGGYWIGVVMILPQVHLRKPCYDFTFL